MSLTAISPWLAAQSLNDRKKKRGYFLGFNFRASVGKCIDVGILVPRELITVKSLVQVSSLLSMIRPPL